MNLRETKQYFEQLYADQWVETEVHYAGADFDGSKQASWVNLTYKPLRQTSNGISKSTNINMGQVYVVCWCDTDAEVMALSDKVIEFMDNNLDNTRFRSKGYEIIDHGWGDSDKVFVVLAFTFEEFVGTC